MRVLFKPVRYVFYRILTWKLRDPRESTPVVAASLVTVLLLWVNLLCATMITNAVRGRLLLADFPGGRVGLSAFAVSWLLSILWPHTQ